MLAASPLHCYGILATLATASISGDLPNWDLGVQVFVRRVRASMPCPSRVGNAVGACHSTRPGVDCLTDQPCPDVARAEAWGLRPPNLSTGCGRRPLCGVIGCTDP